MTVLSVLFSGIIIKGGRLTIKTYVEGNETVLKVSDEGGGIAPEFIDKIGTPFFTTEENGTGLGLAVCYSIVNRHNGEMIVNTDYQGTSFSVRFPIG